MKKMQARSLADLVRMSERLGPLYEGIVDQRAEPSQFFVRDFNTAGFDRR